MFREGESYYRDEQPTEAEREEQDKRPPGLYKCPECGDATITWHSTIDKYKVKCPKCSTEMRRVALIPKPVPVVIKTNELDESAEQYGLRAWWSKKRAEADMQVQSEIAEIGRASCRERV